jgi:hypothetical protein
MAFAPGFYRPTLPSVITESEPAQNSILPSLTLPCLALHLMPFLFL